MCRGFFVATGPRPISHDTNGSIWPNLSAMTLRDPAMKRSLLLFMCSLVMLVAPAACADPLAPFSFPKLDRLEKKLQLTADQKVQFDIAVAASKRAMLFMTMTAMQFKEKLRAEFEKPVPDLRALAEAREAILEDSRPLRREAKEEWLKLYGMLNADQVIAAKSLLADQLEQMWLFHEFMLKLILGSGR